MRKILFVLTAVFALSAGTTAFAATASYDNTNNAVSASDVGDYTTVIIARGESFPASVQSSDIVYINQFESNALSAGANFLIKQNPDDGRYTALFGNASGQNTSVTFIVGAVKDAVPLTLLGTEDNGNGTHKVGFKIEGVSFDDYNVITVEINGKMGGYPLDQIFGSISGTVNLGLQIDDVPDEYLEKINVYLGNGSLSGTTIDKESWAEEAE